MYLIRETFLRYKTKTFCLAFNRAKENDSSKKKMQLRTKQNCERNLVKRETKVQNKLSSKIKLKISQQCP